MGKKRFTKQSDAHRKQSRRNPATQHHLKGKQYSTLGAEQQTLSKLAFHELPIFFIAFLHYNY
jgi:hypothetical protein